MSAMALIRAILSDEPVDLPGDASAPASERSAALRRSPITCPRPALSWQHHLPTSRAGDDDGTTLTTNCHEPGRVAARLTAFGNALCGD